ncbi:hypothetical protein D3C75_1019230 [compost metagenome]
MLQIRLKRGIPERSVPERSQMKEMCLIGNLIRLTNGGRQKELEQVAGLVKKS